MILVMMNKCGTIKVQSAQNYLGVWTNVTESREYLDQTRSDYITVNSAISQYTVPLTYICWFKMDVQADSVFAYTLIGHSGTSATGSGMALQIGGGSRLQRLWGIVYNGAGSQIQFGKTSAQGTPPGPAESAA